MSTKKRRKSCQKSSSGEVIGGGRRKRGRKSAADGEGVAAEVAVALVEVEEDGDLLRLEEEDAVGGDWDGGDGG